MANYQRYNIQKFLKEERLFLGITGFVSSNLKFHLPTGVTYILTTMQILASIYYGLFTTDLAEITAAFMITLSHINTLNKLFGLHLKSLTALDQILVKQIFALADDRELTILKRTLTACQNMLTMYLVTILGAILLYGATPLVANYNTMEKNYPTSAKFPFNPDDYYWAVFAGEFFIVTLSALSNGCMDRLFAKHVAIATGLLKILRHKIRQIMDVDDQKVIEAKMKHCVLYYNEVIGYAKQIENQFSFGIFIQFLCSCIVICLSEFQVLLATSSETVGLLLTYLICMITQTTVYCWYGHQLMEESNSISMEFYNLNWLEMSVKNRKTMLTSKERAKYPIVLKASGVFPLNLATLMIILRTSYSYFAVLHQVYTK